MYPPFIDAVPELPLLSQSDRKRTGHMFQDCPAYDLPPAKGKVKACEPCVARWQTFSGFVAARQAAFDAEWYAAQQEGDHVSIEAETEMWDAIARSDTGVSIPKVDRYEAHVDVPPARRAPERTNRFAGRCSLCGFTVQANEGTLAGVPGAWVTTHKAGACPTPVGTVADWRDAVDVPDGLYALDTEEGARNTVAFYKVDHGREGTKWAGFTFLSRLVGGNPDVPIKGAAKDTILRRIAEDPQAASTRFGRETGRCGRCNTLLTDDASRAAGIGPVCASKGW